MAIPEIKIEDVERLEKQIDKMNENLPELTSFILPGGHPVVSYCHLARTVCRRAERWVIEITESENINSLLIEYLNRLSDYFFVLARKIAVDFDSEEVLWSPSKG